jgi:hypothetical protein
MRLLDPRIAADKESWLQKTGSVSGGNELGSQALSFSPPPSYSPHHSVQLVPFPFPPLREEPLSTPTKKFSIPPSHPGTAQTQDTHLRMGLSIANTPLGVSCLLRGEQPLFPDNSWYPILYASLPGGLSFGGYRQNPGRRLKDLRLTQRQQSWDSPGLPRDLTQGAKHVSQEET